MHSTQPAATSPIQTYLEGLHREFTELRSGGVASYIPELAKVDPDGFGIVVATVDGQVYEVGDTRRLFTIQSVSKPFVYGVAMEDRGLPRVLQAIGVEPSGDPFNAISLEPGTGRPLNPMINAGAIAASSLVVGATKEACLARVLGALSAFAGRALDVDHSVYESERDTGHRNRAIGHLLRNHGIIDGDPEPALDLYFRQCAVQVDGRDLALMAATLANGGVNPTTGARAIGREFVEPMLSVMATCGMYDDSGTWLFDVGLPAKSGVGGGVIAVLPGQLGIAVYSPRLDPRGNSARGVAVFRRMSTELGLHFLQPPRPSASTMRAQYTLQSVRSKRQRLPAEAQRLMERGAQARVYELQGDLRLGTLEPVLRAIVEAEAAITVLDFKRVGQADRGATRMLAALASRCAARGQHLVLSRVRRGDLLDDLGNQLAPDAIPVVVFQPQLDAALEWCERHLLADGASSQTASRDADADITASLTNSRLCRGMEPDALALLQAQLLLSHHEPGSLIVQRGEQADALYLLASGEVSVVVDLPGGGIKRLSTLSSGMVFGEAALIAGGLRSAHVRADTSVSCWALSANAFAQLKVNQPALAITLMQNLLTSASDTITRLTAEVAALEG